MKDAHFFVVPGGWSGAVAGVDGSGIASGDGAGVELVKAR